MAPKNILNRLMKHPFAAVSQSSTDLKRRSIIDVDPRMIDSGGLQDRLEETKTDMAALVDSMRTYGQQVPVLLRPNPNDPERYQIVYGRRRVAALKVLGQQVKALVRVLDDNELVIAQGQENAARRDLTFIEKANFARQMRDNGYARKIICDALHMDKTLISRLLSVADKIPFTLIEAIGAAPAIGRERWMLLAHKIAASDENPVSFALGDTSDERFAAVLKGVSAPKPTKPVEQPLTLNSETGVALATSIRRQGNLVLTLSAENSDGFDQWLVENLPHIHHRWHQKHSDYAEAQQS